MLSCPLCGELLSTMVLLQQHVNACLDQDLPRIHHGQQRSAGSAASSRTRNEGSHGFPSSSGPIIISDTSSEEEYKMDETNRTDVAGVTDLSASPAQAATAAPYSTGGTGLCVLCPLGCNQWIPVSEIDSHEISHQV